MHRRLRFFAPNERTSERRRRLLRRRRRDRGALVFTHISRTTAGESLGKGEDSGELLAIKRAFTFPSRKSQHILLLLLFKVWISFHYTNIELSASAKYETGRGNAGTANFIGAEHILKCLKS